MGSVWVWALLWPLYAVVPNLMFLAALTGSIFLVFPIYNVVQMSYRLQRIPDELQGRVNSAFRLIAFAGQPVGMALMGALLQMLGVTRTVLLGAVWLVLLAAMLTLSPAMREGGRWKVSPSR